MENASKALLMAGGILIAIIILSIIVYMGTTTSRLAKSQDEKVLAEQTAEFNAQYEAYIKSRMYGTDVITVINKAKDYNTRLGTSEENYKINIILVLNQDFDRTTQTVKRKANGEIEYGDITTVQEGTLKKGTYQLFERKNSTKMNQDIINFLNQDEKNTTPSNDSETITYVYSAINNFKTAIFRCNQNGVIYNSVTGRIESMTFEQI